MGDFFAMGGYAFYVWMSLGITAVVLVANFWLAASYHRHQVDRIKRRMRRER